jgi:hypothetical protein
MEVIIFIILMIAAFLVISSGVWVAIALVSAISTHREQANKEKTIPQCHKAS